MTRLLQFSFGKALAGAGQPREDESHQLGVEFLLKPLDHLEE